MRVEGKDFEPQRLLNSILPLGKGLKVSLTNLISRVTPGFYDGVTGPQVLTLLAEQAASMALQHPDYSILAARLECKKLYKTTPASFSEAMAILAQAKAVTCDLAERAPAFDEYIEHDRDSDFTYFGLATLLKSYLLRKDGAIIERPQYMLMRVALSIHNDKHLALETYEHMSKRYFIHATPTLFNAGTLKHQYSSCFLKAMDEDSIEGIFETLKDCAIISKHSGGIGLHVSNIRARNSTIQQSGTAGGLVPMLRVFNNMARFVDQGGNKRPGAISITLEPWHADLLDFIDLRKNHGKEENRARDLFLALWVPDLFMRTVEANETWYLFSPDKAPGLSDVCGTEFEQLYKQYVDEERYTAAVPAQVLWRAIMVAQIETGNPSILYKDSCNLKSNQRNLGTIKSSNLCTEIIQFSSPAETAVCNLASVALPSFVVDSQFDFELLHKVVKIMTVNLDKVIDLNFYPLESARTSNLRHRPMGIGVQGLADVYAKLSLAFDSAEAATLNKRIFETIYHASVEQSCDLAKELGHYETFPGSPASQGLLQFDLWGVTPQYYDWSVIKARVEKHGLRNSLLTALMPTASTSQILGCTECFEPVTSNIYSRRVLSGEFQLVNTFLVQELEKLDMWTHEVRQQIMANHGSVQSLSIPEHLKQVFKTVWEIKQRNVIDQCAERGPFIDQSQSMNIFLASPTTSQLTSMHFYGWKQGLKTGIYYLRSRPASMPTPVTVEVSGVASPSIKRLKAESEDSCEFCSS